MNATARSVKKKIEEIAGQPYTRELVKNEDGTWFARVAEFTGCMTEGQTANEAIASLEDAMAAWIETHLEDGDPIPPPATSDRYSGKFLMRVPKTLHRELAKRADMEGVSLNQYALSTLSRAVGLNC